MSEEIAQKLPEENVSSPIENDSLETSGKSSVSRIPHFHKKGFLLVLFLIAVPLILVVFLAHKSYFSRSAGATEGVATCAASDISSLQNCLVGLRSNTYDSIYIKSMITCPDYTKCRIDLSGLSNKTIYGNPDWSTGILRTDHSSARNAIIFVGLNANTSNITLKDLVLDDNYSTFDNSEYVMKSTETCTPNKPNTYKVNPKLIRPLQVMGGSNITVDHINIRNYNETGAWISHVNGFTFINSKINHGQHLGMVVGEAFINGANPPGTFSDGYGYTNNVKIQNDTFQDIGVNGLVVQGVRGTAYGQNIIQNNTFDSVHDIGLYDCSGGVAGQIFSGGMLLTTDANYLTVQSNTFENGNCKNCNAGTGLGIPHEVRGIEMDGIYQKNGFTIGTNNVKYIDNTFTDIIGYGIHHDYCLAGDAYPEPNPDKCPNFDYGPVSNILFQNNTAGADVTLGLFVPLGKFGHIHGTNISFATRPKQDAYVDMSQPDKNFGALYQNIVGENPTKIAYFDFDVSSFPAFPAGKPMKKATLQLHVAPGSVATAADVFNIKLFSTKGEVWKEGNINYTNKPDLSTTIQSSFNGDVPGQEIDADLTSWIKSSLVNNIASFAVKSPATNNLSVYSRRFNNPNSPELQMDY